MYRATVSKLVGGKRVKETTAYNTKEEYEAAGYRVIDESKRDQYANPTFEYAGLVFEATDGAIAKSAGLMFRRLRGVDMSGSRFKAADGTVYYFESNDDFDAWALAGETAVESAEFGE